MAPMLVWCFEGDLLHYVRPVLLHYEAKHGKTHEDAAVEEEAAGDADAEVLGSFVLNCFTSNEVIESVS